MPDRLKELQRFMNGWYEGSNFDDTFVVGSQMHSAAKTCDLPIEVLATQFQTDMFDTSEPDSVFVLDLLALENMIPISFGGAQIEREHESYSNPFAYDENRVLIQCPRGMCIIERTRYDKGIRHCVGC